MTIDTNKTDTANVETLTNNPPTVDVMNTALVDLAKADEKAAGAGFRFAVALFNYRSELAHSLSDMIYNRTVKKVDKKSGKVGTDTVSVNALHKTFLQTLPAYVEAEKDAKKAVMDSMTALDTDKAAVIIAKQENAKSFIGKTRTAMIRAVSIAYTLDGYKAQNLVIEKSGKELSFDFPLVTVKDGKETTTWRHVHYTYTRLLNLADKYVSEQKVKPVKATQPQSQQGQDNVTVTVPTGTEAQTAEGMSKTLQSLPEAKRKEIADAPQTEVLLCNILAAKFMKDRVLDLPAFYTWLSTQPYFKTDGHSINGQIVPTSTLVKRERKAAAK